VGDDDVSAEKARLRETLEVFRRKNGFGRGIAAPQIGVTRRFIALNLGKGAFTLSDPEITWKSDKRISLWDDCMSLPWILCKVERHESISIQYIDDKGTKRQWENIPPAESELLQHGT
jgi:peptide deformylase